MINRLYKFITGASFSLATTSCDPLSAFWLVLFFFTSSCEVFRKQWREPPPPAGHLYVLWWTFADVLDSGGKRTSKAQSPLLSVILFVTFCRMFYLSDFIKMFFQKRRKECSFSFGLKKIPSVKRKSRSLQCKCLNNCSPWMWNIIFF